VNPRSHGYHWLILASFIVVGIPSWTDAQDPSASREPSTGKGSPTAIQTTPATSATTETQPFWVAGVVITAAQRSAFLVVLDDVRREVGVVTLREGESYGGYRVATVEADRVFFERNGTVVPVVVGRPHGGPSGAVSAPARSFFIPGPDKPTPDVPYTGPQFKRRGEAGAAPAPPGNAPDSQAPDPEALKKILEALSNHPQFQQRMQERGPTPQEPASTSNVPSANSR